MAKLVSKTYGDALFELAVEQDLLETIMVDITFAKEVWMDNVDISKILLQPQTKMEERLTMLKEIFQGRVSDTMVGFLSIMVEKKHNQEIMNVFEYVSERYKEYKKIGVAYIATAIELGEQQKIQVEKQLIQVTKYIEFEMNYRVDAELIGGMVIQIGDRVLDSSIKSKMNIMANELSKIHLN